MSRYIEQKPITKKEIESAVNKSFGNGEDFFLLKFSQESCILLTPFITQENEYIELGIDIIGEKRILITDFGKIKKAAEKVIRKISGQKFKYCEEIKNILAESFAGEVKIESGLSDIGLDVQKIISLLQKIYNLEILLKSDKRPGFDQFLGSAFLNIKKPAHPLYQHN